MPRMRRYIKSKTLYEVSFRAKSTLPFCCTEYMEQLINSALARVQRDDKVILHHYIFEGSHPHIICTARDAEQCHRFYGQLKKQLTESIKRLLGLEHLTLWKSRASVIEIPTLEDAINSIGYLYSNPSNDDLTESIEGCPGVSSWQANTEATLLDDCIMSEHPWIQQPMIPEIPKCALTSKQDKFISEKMLSLSNKEHVLKVYANSWIKLFINNRSAEEVERIRLRIMSNLREREAKNAERRAETGKELLGAKKLKTQALLKLHTPNKKGRKIFVKTMFKEIRLRIIKEMQIIDALCRTAYEQWKVGVFKIPWPAGTFPPPLPHQANALA